MVTPYYGAAREITEYFNSPAFHAPNTSELLSAIMQELMHRGESPTDKAIITNVIARLEGEMDETMLQGYRDLIIEIMSAETPPLSR